MASFICKCEKLCKSYDDYCTHHIDTIASWGERLDFQDEVESNKENIEKMLRDEPFARRRRAAKARMIAAGYVPKPQQKCTSAKPTCNKCVVVDGKIVASNCCNPKCTFLHGKFDNREHVRQAAM